MKTLIITLLILTAAGVCICYIPKQPSTEVSVMVDITDLQLAQPKASELIPLFGLSANPWGGALFRFQSITNVSLNPASEESISPANEWLSNEIERGNDVQAFDGQVSQILLDSSKVKTGLKHSSVYLPIATELNLLSQSSAHTRILIAYTDLMENDPNYSFYNKRIFSMLKSEPDTVMQHFESKLPLNNLNGVKVYLVYQPQNAYADLVYQQVSQWYKSMLNAAGATVIVTANLAN